MCGNGADAEPSFSTLNPVANGLFVRALHSAFRRQWKRFIVDSGLLKVNVSFVKTLIYGISYRRRPGGILTGSYRADAALRAPI